MRVVPWLVIAAIAGACALPSADEFARAPAATPDGGNDSGSALIEAGVDASSDGAAPVDAGADAPAGFCPRTAVYCNDFNSGTVSDVGPNNTTPGASLTIVNGTLEAKLPALPGPGFNGASVDYGLPLGGVRVNADVDVNVSEAAWNGGNAIIVGIYYNSQPQAHAEELYIDGNISSVTTSENDNLLFDNATIPLARGKWVHVRMEADFTAHNGSFRVFYDGALATTHDGPIDFIWNGVTGFNVSLGLQRSNAPTPAIAVTYDNLVITLP